MSARCKAVWCSMFAGVSAAYPLALAGAYIPAMTACLWPLYVVIANMVMLHRDEKRAALGKDAAQGE